jgi:uncharacterized protein
MRAAVNGHLEAVKALAAGGADVNAQNNIGKTVFMVVAENGHAEVAKELDASGADLNVKDDMGETTNTRAAGNALLECRYQRAGCRRCRPEREGRVCKQPL